MDLRYGIVVDFLSLPLWQMGNFVEPFGLHFLLVVTIFSNPNHPLLKTPLTVMVLGLFLELVFVITTL